MKDAKKVGEHELLYTTTRRVEVKVPVNVGEPVAAPAAEEKLRHLLRLQLEEEAPAAE